MSNNFMEISWVRAQRDMRCAVHCSLQPAGLTDDNIVGESHVTSQSDFFFIILTNSAM